MLNIAALIAVNASMTAPNWSMVTFGSLAMGASEVVGRIVQEVANG